MSKFFDINKDSFRPAVCLRHDDEEPVQSGLAYTPSRMMELAEQGIPISVQTAGNSVSYDEGYRTLDYEPALEWRRGTDINDIWEAQMDARENVNKAFKNAREKVPEAFGQKGDE